MRLPKRIFRRLLSISWRMCSRVYVVCLHVLKRLPAPQKSDEGAYKKTVFLTFDDGPCRETAVLLDTLKRYNIRATFFVNGDREPALLSRMTREGHTVGNHSYSHSYRHLYASEEAFFQDIENMSRLIHTRTGDVPWLLRFPGGSSNTVSRFNPGIMARLTAAVEEKGLCYTDWNVDSGDKHPITARKIYRNIISGIQSTEMPVVLRHMDVPNSMAVVERVLIWGLRHNCVFLPLGHEDPLIHHKLNN